MLTVAFGINLRYSSPNVDIFLSVAKALERVLAVVFGTNYVVSSPTVGIFLYVRI